MWTFLVLSIVAFYLPAWLLPAALQKSATYVFLNDAYQLLLVIAGFWYGPALCRALVLKRMDEGVLRERVDLALTELRSSLPGGRLPALPVLLFDYPASFILTIGLLPTRSEIFLSSGFTRSLGDDGLRFLLARALAHGKFSQRCAAVLPVLVLTLMPGMPASWREWLALLSFLLAWLLLHWIFELLADRAAARRLGAGAEIGLREILAASAPTPGGISLRAPLSWRLYVLKISSRDGAKKTV